MLSKRKRKSNGLIVWNFLPNFHLNQHSISSVEKKPRHTTGLNLIMKSDIFLFHENDFFTGSIFTRCHPIKIDT
jgi:hypothetical protein